MAHHRRQPEVTSHYEGTTDIADLSLTSQNLMMNHWSLPRLLL